MRIVCVGAGAVGGYYSALLSRAGHEVVVIARGAHRDAIRQHGLRIASAAVGDFTVRIRAESDPAIVGPADLVLFAVKTYDNDSALPLLTPLVGRASTVLTLQNGVESADAVAGIVGRGATLGGATYIATAVESPGVIRQTGSHRRIVFGEWFEPSPAPSARVVAIEQILKAADIHAEAVADARPSVWEKFVYLAPFAACTGAARLPVGPIWSDEDSRRTFVAAIDEVAAVARAAGVAIPDDTLHRIETYAAGIPPTTRSSLLIDLTQGRRIEVESLLGAAVRLGRSLNVPTPTMSALYGVLKPYAGGPPVA